MQVWRWCAAALAGLLLVGCGPARATTGARSAAVADAPRRIAPTTGASPTAAGGPQERGFRLEGPFERRAGGIWLIDGAPVLVSDDTLLVGAPAEGAWVTVEGRLAADGSRRASVIGAIETVEIVGRLERIEADSWVIDGAAVRVGPETATVAPPPPGVYLRVIARIVVDAGGPRLLALRISIARELTLIGHVDSRDDTTLVIGGRALALTPESMLAIGVSPGAAARPSWRRR